MIKPSLPTGFAETLAGFSAGVAIDEITARASALRMMIADFPQRKRFLVKPSIWSPVLRGRCFLIEACGGNNQLRQEIDELISAWEGAGDFLNQSAAAAVVDVFPPRTLMAPGTVIGPYKLLEQIGEGGMGVVYMAEQTEPVRRRVALKIIKPGMDTRQVIARFEAERQALALMDHPTSPGCSTPGDRTGRPYFVMELVARHPDHRLLRPEQSQHAADGWNCSCTSARPCSTRIRKASFIATSSRRIFWSRCTTACRCPRSSTSASPRRPAQQLTDKTLFTNFAQMIGTPSYMSPEQAEMSGLDVDTRSDIYSPGRAAVRAADGHDAV